MWCWLIRISITIILVPIICSSQETSGHKAFSTIPVEQQPRLIVRLKEQIENERNRDWPSMFALLPKQHTQNPNLTLEEFVVSQNRWKTKSMYVLDFVPSSTTDNIAFDGDYMIFGCAKSKDGWFSEWTEASISVAFENGDWYIDQVHWVFPGLHAAPRSCKPDKKNNPLRVQV